MRQEERWYWSACVGEEGQAYVELLLVLFLILLFVSGILFFGRVLYVGIALDAAAADAARASVETLNDWRGIPQGIEAAQRTLRGYYLDPAAAGIRVAPLAGWTYGYPVRSDVSYRTYVGDIPFVGWFYPDQTLRLHSTVFLRVEEFKSRWAW
ncbi:MAG TPA: hypothetical protein DCP08_06430 [Chloroflexi bacterium]|nr:hypothetical protein [Chloroflexota bacterium]